MTVLPGAKPQTRTRGLAAVVAGLLICCLFAVADEVTAAAPVARIPWTVGDDGYADPPRIEGPRVGSSRIFWIEGTRVFSVPISGGETRTEFNLESRLPSYVTGWAPQPGDLTSPRTVTRRAIAVAGQRFSAGLRIDVIHEACLPSAQLEGNCSRPTHETLFDGAWRDGGGADPEALEATDTGSGGPICDNVTEPQLAVNGDRVVTSASCLRSGSAVLHSEPLRGSTPRSSDVELPSDRVLIDLQVSDSTLVAALKTSDGQIELRSFDPTTLQPLATVSFNTLTVRGCNNNAQPPLGWALDGNHIVLVCGDAAISSLDLEGHTLASLGRVNLGGDQPIVPALSGVRRVWARDGSVLVRVPATTDPTPDRAGLYAVVSGTTFKLDDDEGDADIGGSAAAFRRSECLTTAIYAPTRPLSATSAPAVTACPLPRLTGQSAQLGARNLARVGIECPQPGPLGCAGTAVFEHAYKPNAKSSVRWRRLGARPQYAVASGTQGTVGSYLDKRAVEYLSRGGSLPMRVRFAQSGGNGSAVQEFTVTAGGATLKKLRASIAKSCKKARKHSKAARRCARIRAATRK